MPEAPIALCSWKGCNKPASHHFRWEWGEEGNCCDACLPLLQQTATNLSRTVQFKRLDQTAEAPVTRSERTLLIAAKLSAEAELEEVQKRGTSLYQSNVDLTQQVQTHVMRAREHAAIVEEKDSHIERLSADLEKRERELGEATAELGRLRTLAQFAGPAKGGKDPKAKEAKGL